jgi:hypothetical protein
LVSGGGGRSGIGTRRSAARAHRRGAERDRIVGGVLLRRGRIGRRGAAAVGARRGRRRILIIFSSRS